MAPCLYLLQWGQNVGIRKSQNRTSPTKLLIYCKRNIVMTCSYDPSMCHAPLRTSCEFLTVLSYSAFPFLSHMYLVCIKVSLTKYGHWSVVKFSLFLCALPAINPIFGFLSAWPWFPTPCSLALRTGITNIIEKKCIPATRESNNPQLAKS